MSIHNPFRLFALAVLVLLSQASTEADILRWDTGEVIPGTEGIVPGPRGRPSTLEHGGPQSPIRGF